MIALLFALLTIGAPPCQEGVAQEWEIEYADGVVENYATGGGELTFEERPFRRWRSRRLPAWPATWSAWSEWHAAEPYPGDVNGDARVDVEDFRILLKHFGDVAP